MTKKLTMGLMMIVAVSLFASTSVVFAESNWAKEHPRRHEVNRRLKNQNRRIHKEVREGEMTKADARKLHREDRGIRQEEKIMARQNGGHITKQEQRTLNQQENGVSREIGK